MQSSLMELHEETARVEKQLTENIGDMCVIVLRMVHIMISRGDAFALMSIISCWQP